MNTHDRIPETRLTAGLADLAGPSTPGLRDEILAATARTRQRPAWSYLERWLPMAVITRPMAVPALRPLWLLLIALLLIILATGGLIVGASLLRSDAAVPMGGAAVLAFDDTAGTINTIRADGTDLRRLTDGTGASLPSWSPDGKRIAYRQEQGTLDQVMVMDAGGGNVITVTPTGLPAGSCLKPDAPLVWSPDGRFILIATGDRCTADTSVSTDLVIVPSDRSSSPVRLVAPGTQSISPSWSPDGSRIAFVGRDDVTRTTGLYVVDVDDDPLVGGFTPRRIADGQGPMLDQAYSPPTWSPDGTEVAATVGSQQACYGNYTEMTWDVVIVNVLDGTQRPLATEPAVDEMNPVWSPDGTRVAFHRTVDPSEYFDDRPCTVRTWVIDAEGANERELAKLEDHFPGPLWSPDGTRLIGTVIEPVSGAFQVSVIPVDDGGTVITLPDASGSASWQPKAAPLPPAPSFGTP